MFSTLFMFINITIYDNVIITTLWMKAYIIKKRFNSLKYTKELMNVEFIKQAQKGKPNIMWHLNCTGGVIKYNILHVLGFGSFVLFICMFSIMKQAVQSVIEVPVNIRLCILNLNLKVMFWKLGESFLWI